MLESAGVGIGNGLREKVPVLYAAGDLDLLKLPAVAIVGSRKASDEGQRRAARLARELVREGIAVMSGLAAGIDAAAHRAAIEHGGRTIAVIGTALDKAYPSEHAELQQLIYEKHLLLSPFRLGERTFPSAFPLRNRVMARMARATVIVEASDTSGSLHQAAESIRVGHPVFIAESVVTDPTLTWPARLLGGSHAYILRNPLEVIVAAKAP